MYFYPPHASCSERRGQNEGGWVEGSPQLREGGVKGRVVYTVIELTQEIILCASRSL